MTPPDDVSEHSREELEQDEVDCVRCLDSGRVITYYGLGQMSLDPCPECTEEGTDD